MRKELRIITLAVFLTLLSMTNAWSIDFETGIGLDTQPIVNIGAVTFGGGWVYNVDFDAPGGGGGAQANEPSDETVALLNGNLVVVPADTRITFPSDVSSVSFWYSLDTTSGNRVVSFYNQSGVLLGTITLNQCGSTLCSPGLCVGDPNGSFCSWTQVNFSANNIRYM
jgi:hypothetical protein